MVFLPISLWAYLSLRSDSVDETVQFPYEALSLS